MGRCSIYSLTRPAAPEDYKSDENAVLREDRRQTTIAGEIIGLHNIGARAGGQNLHSDQAARANGVPQYPDWLTSGPEFSRSRGYDDRELRPYSEAHTIFSIHVLQ